MQDSLTHCLNSWGLIQVLFNQISLWNLFCFVYECHLQVSLCEEALRNSNHAFTMHTSVLNLCFHAAQLSSKLGETAFS